MKQAITVATLIGTVAIGVWAVEERYARAVDVQHQISEIKQLYINAELRALKKDRFELESAAQRRPLTDLERRRLQEVIEEIERMERGR